MAANIKGGWLRGVDVLTPVPATMIEKVPSAFVVPVAIFPLLSLILMVAPESGRPVATVPVTVCVTVVLAVEELLLEEEEVLPLELVKPPPPPPHPERTSESTATIEKNLAITKRGK